MITVGEDPHIFISGGTSNRLTRYREDVWGKKEGCGCFAYEWRGDRRRILLLIIIIIKDRSSFSSFFFSF